MLITSNPMIYVLHNIMWSIGKNVTHEAKGKNSTSRWALVDQDIQLQVSELQVGGSLKA